MDANSYLMPFGFAKGKPIAEVPSHYISWLLKKGVTDPLKSEIEKELSRRGESSGVDPGDRVMDLVTNLVFDSDGKVTGVDKTQLIFSKDGILKSIKG